MRLQKTFFMILAGCLAISTGYADTLKVGTYEDPAEIVEMLSWKTYDNLKKPNCLHKLLNLPSIRAQAAVGNPILRLHVAEHPQLGSDVLLAFPAYEGISRADSVECKVSK